MQLRSEQPDAAEQMERRQLADRLAAAVNKLGDRCRQLYRHKLAGKSYDEIRDLMGAKTTGAVYTWDFRCREQLRTQIGGRS
jgi:RNA polymerase sigma-70 factor (ECF subfamily)